MDIFQWISQNIYFKNRFFTGLLRATASVIRKLDIQTFNSKHFFLYSINITDMLYLIKI